MNPNIDNDADDLQNVYNPLSAMQRDEKVLCEIKRHPIGIIGVYIAAAIAIVAVLTAAALLPTYISTITDQNKIGLWLGAGLISVIALLYAYVASVVYKGNRWILTDDSLTQVKQDGLFRNHSSQLSLANLEDVTADQNGVFQSIFGFGMLRVETAGERSKFVFPYCPNPNECARQILTAREAFIANEPTEAARANDKLGVPQTPAGYQQPYQPLQQPSDPNQIPASSDPQNPPQNNQY
ncbi:MAG: PH domain-containing protein [Candidatus Saccharimonadales bacterium]